MNIPKKIYFRDQKKKISKEFSEKKNAIQRCSDKKILHSKKRSVYNELFFD